MNIFLLNRLDTPTQTSSLKNVLFISRFKYLLHWDSKLQTLTCLCFLKIQTKGLQRCKEKNDFQLKAFWINRSVRRYQFSFREQVRLIKSKSCWQSALIWVIVGHYACIAQLPAQRRHRDFRLLADIHLNLRFLNQLSSQQPFLLFWTEQTLKSSFFFSPWH